MNTPFVNILAAHTTFAGLDIRIWEVGHGLAVRIRTPNGQNHFIDAGSSPGFSPAEHIYAKHWRATDAVDFLVISHQDSDHIDDLPTFLKLLGRPRAYLRNRSVPADEKYGSLTLDYQKALWSIDAEYTGSVDQSQDPRRYENNGGVYVDTYMLDWNYCAGNINNASVLVSYTYAGISFIFPGDLEPLGWSNLVSLNSNLLANALDSQLRILVAPHHGRESGYSKEMLDYIKPDLIVISDGHGVGETDPRFRTAATGVSIDGVETKYVTTKNRGRKKFTVSPVGEVTIHEADE
jgi:beta-lactamase superfamily II metal-dependent hydrolase